MAGAADRSPDCRGRGWPNWLSLGVGLDDLDGGSIAFNSKTYTIETHVVKPAPTGELLGEVYLIMTEG